ncbi:MAG: 2-oxo acid dehydrogenase subunit E2 [Deltaproteobacteria bacterium]|nr:2-oxo acid dehydrogenase subunit E2 [Deltaproteobacteria bacterium]
MVGDKRVDVHPYRVLMPYIMPRRSDAAVFLEIDAEVEKTLEFIEKYNKASHKKITVFYVFLYSVLKSLIKFPELNRYIRGKRIYQRGEISIAFSMKVEKTVESPMKEVKLRFSSDIGFDEFVEYVDDSINKARVSVDLDADKKSRIFSKVPRLLLMIAIKMIYLLDFFCILPRSFTRDDPFFSSVFVTNLGSLGIGAVFHHLYEYGNCPFFINIGKIYKKAVVENDRVAIKEILPIRITFDERIVDGFTASRGLLYMKDVIENTVRYL